MADNTQLTVNQKVVVWVRAKLGKKVGAGECWDLAEEALKHAGALTSNDLGTVGEDTDYVWGTRIENVKDLIPGDIIQIRDHEVKTTTLRQYSYPDGAKENSTETETAVRPHHTAVVNSTLDQNDALKTLEQHVKPKGNIVQNKTLYTRSVPPAVTTGTESRLNPISKKRENAKFTMTVTITVTGTLWLYRPKAK